MGRIEPLVGREDMQTASGDAEADILRRYDRLIRHFARRYRFDVDDLAQIGRLELLQAYRLWQSKPRHASFWTYARRAVVGGMLNFVMRESVRLSKELESGVSPSSFPAQDLALEAKEHVEVLSSREASVLGMYAAGFNAEEIAEESGMGRTHVYRILGDCVENIRRRA